MSDQLRENIASSDLKPQIAPKPVELPPIIIDLSKPPESVLSAPTENLKISSVENPVDHSEAEVKSLDETVVEHKPKLGGNPIQRFKNWLGYPSSNVKNTIQDKIRTPAIIVATAGISGMVLTSFSLLSSLSENPVFLGNVINVFLGCASVTGVSLLTERISDAVSRRIVKREIKNRIPFSNLVTVSKVYDSAVGFSGELHFVGRNSQDWKEIDSKTQKIKDILVGLRNLAQACEENDPRILNINTFKSSSSILHPNYFSNLGFKFSDASEPNARRKFGMRLMSFWNSLINHAEESYTGEFVNEKKYNAIITRQFLIDAKGLISQKIIALNNRT